MSELDFSFYELRIPFTRSFVHASAARNTSATVLVQVNDAGGQHGYGEGCPREYVTGESIGTAAAFFSEQLQHFARIQSLQDLQSCIREHAAVIDTNPSAWTAVETALLDLFAQQQGVNVEALLQRRISSNRHQYTAVLGDSSPASFQALFHSYLDLGFRDFKIKLGADPDRDRDRLQTISSCPERIRVRADANNLWPDTSAALAYLQLLNFPFAAIEEPLASRDFADLAVVARETGMKIVLDESLLQASQLAALEAHPDYWIVNARISKYGGLLRALDMVDALADMGISIVVGTHVGETSLLTRAAWLLADAAGRCLWAMEGGFSTHLLTLDPFTPNLKFGRGGRIDDSLYACRELPGFGLQAGFDLDAEPWAISLI